MSSLTRFSRRTGRKTRRIPAMIESLEARQLLDGATPFFVTPLTDQYMSVDGALTLGIDGFDADGDALTITATSDAPWLKLTVPNGNRYARLHFVQADGVTSIGDVVVQLFMDAGGAATERFITLATNQVNADKSLNPDGTPFYTHVAGHRVIEDFMIQTGDAVKGDGTGGSPLGYFDSAFDPVYSFSGVGALGMAHGTSVDTNDSQFFITTGPAPWLDQVHMIFGQVVSGWDTLEILNTVHTNSSSRPDQAPYNPPFLENVQIFDGNQDGTLTMQATHKAGGTAHVTVRLNDGNGNVFEQTITVTALGIADPGVIHVQPGASGSFTPVINGLDEFQMSVTQGLVGATATFDNLTGQVNFTTPTDFHGAFRIKLEVIKPGDTRIAVRYVWVAPQTATESTVIGGLDLGAGNIGYASATAGDRLYVAAGTGGLQIYSMAAPASAASPSLLGTYRGLEDVQNVTVVGNIAYVADANLGLAVLDVTDPNNVVREQLIDVGGDVQDMLIVGTRMYVAAMDAGLVVYDLRTPDNITEMGRKDVLTPGLEFAAASSVVVHGKYAYVVDARGAIMILKVARPSNIKFVNLLATGGAPWGSDKLGTVMYVADRLQGIMSWDLTHPVLPRQMGVTPVMGGANSIQIVNQTAIVGTYTKGYAFVGVNNPRSMSLKHFISSDGQGGEGTAYGDRFILPMRAEGLVVADGSGLLDQIVVDKNSKFTDSNGKVISFSVKGGELAVGTSGVGVGTITTLKFTPTSYTTGGAVSVRIAGGQEITVSGVEITATCASFNAPGVNVAGNVVLTSAVGKVALGDVIGTGVAGGRTINIGAAAYWNPITTSLSFERMADVLLTSSTALSALTATEWLDTDATRDVIKAPWIGTLTTKGNKKLALAGDFRADLNLNETAAILTRNVLNKASVAGNLGESMQNILDDTYNAAAYDATWSLKGAVGSIAVKGTAGNVEIRSTGNLSSLSVGAAGHMDVLVGAGTAVARHAAAAADFTSTTALLRSVKVTGLATPVGAAPLRWFYSDSNVSAPIIGTVSLLNTEFDNSGTTFGVWARENAASTTEIKAVTTLDKVTGQKATWPKDQAQFPQDDMHIDVLP